MAWKEYVDTVGQNQNYRDYLATEYWSTFYGECLLKPQSTWWEHSYTSFGSWQSNSQAKSQSRWSKVEVRFAGFEATTTMSSWREKCKDVDAMADLFRRMPGIPETIKTVWQGLDRTAEETRTMERSIHLQPGYKGRRVATTIVRVVHAVQVFKVSGWYWHLDDNIHGSALTWENLPEWKEVYADRAYVEGRGICQQMPDVLVDGDGNRVRPPPGPIAAVRDPCVNLNNKEVELIIPEVVQPRVEF